MHRVDAKAPLTNENQRRPFDLHGEVKKDGFPFCSVDSKKQQEGLNTPIRTRSVGDSCPWEHKRQQRRRPTRNEKFDGSVKRWPFGTFGPQLATSTGEGQQKDRRNKQTLWCTLLVQSRSYKRRKPLSNFFCSFPEKAEIFTLPKCAEALAKFFC